MFIRDDDNRRGDNDGTIDDDDAFAAISTRYNMRAANARVCDRIHGRDVCSTREVCDTALAPRHCNRGVRKVVGPAETLELREEYGQLYRRDLLLRFATAKLVAADVCASAWYHTRSGGLGVNDLALDPHQSSNSSRRVRNALGLDNSKPYRYFIYVPQWNNAKARREILPLEVRLPHEMIARDFQRRPHLYDTQNVDPVNYKVPQFIAHPVTVAHGEAAVWPIGYYTDAVALGRNNSFYRGSAGVTFIRSRFTLWVMRSSEICKCGCGGACTLDAIQVEMNDSFNHLQDKAYLRQRRDGRPWMDSDCWRRAKVGEELEIRGALCEYRADMPERCAKAGMKGHASNHGCMCCSATNLNLHSRYHECNLANLPWEPRDQSKYLEEVQTHIIKVRVISLDEKN